MVKKQQVKIGGETMTGYGRVEMTMTGYGRVEMTMRG